MAYTLLAPAAALDAPLMRLAPNGLLSSAFPIPDEWIHGRDTAGAIWLPDPASAAVGTLWAPCTADPGSPTVNTGVAKEEVQPVALDVRFECDTLAGIDYLRSMAGHILDVHQEHLAEREVLGGATIADNIDLITGASTYVTATTALAGLTKAQAAIVADGFGAQGMIHAPAELVADWSALFYIQPDADGRLVTRDRKTIVVSYSGYTANDALVPTGQAVSAGQAWIYATGLLYYRLGDVEVIGADDVRQVMNRYTNDVQFIARRQFWWLLDRPKITAIKVTL
jgi:hypothetical protein